MKPQKDVKMVHGVKMSEVWSNDLKPVSGGTSSPAQTLPTHWTTSKHHVRFYLYLYGEEKPNPKHPDIP